MQMAGETPLTIVGNLTADPTLRFTNSGVAVASFTVASTPRIFNRQSGQWEEGTALFLRCSAWRSLAENCAESLKKGMRVIVSGRLTQNNFETREGERRSSIELQVDEIGPSLRYATAQVTRTSGGSGNYGGDFNAQGGSQGGYNQQSSYSGQNYNSGFSAPQGGSADDEWAAPMGGQPSSYDDQTPPF